MPGHTHQHIIFHLKLWLQCVALFRQPYSASPHLFLTRIILIFGKVSYWCWETSQKHSMGLRWELMVVSSSMKLIPQGPRTRLSQFEPCESWHCHPAIWPFSTFRYSADLILLPNVFTKPRPDQVKQPHIITLPPVSCTVATIHDGCITSFASLLTLMCPLLWNRVIWICQITWHFVIASVC